jgi:4a-hydroxytetrahydrobiopterin dehydratase
MPELKPLDFIPCNREEPPLTDEQIHGLKPHVPEWEVIEVEGIKRLQRTFKFKNFAEALEFTNKIGKIAEQQDHHPVLVTQWGKVSVTWWTHVIKGLHHNDFYMAAKTDELYSQ